MTIELLANMATSVIGMNFIGQYCQLKYHGKRRIVYMMIGIFAYFLTVTLLNFLMTFEGLLGFAYLLVMFLYAQLACEGDAVEHAVGTMIWACIILFSTIPVFEILSLITNHNTSQLLDTSHYLRAEMLTAVTVLKFLLSRFMVMIKRTKNLYLDRREEYALIGICFLILLLILGFFTMDINWENKTARHVISMLLLFGTILILILIYIVFRKLSALHLKEITREYTNKAIGKQGEYVRDIENLNKKLQIMRHDMNGHYAALHMFLKSGKYEEAAKYLEELDENTEKYSELPALTGNDGLNAILYKTYCDCREKDIRFKCTIHARVEKIKNSDIGILMYNLMSNAVEAASLADQKQISLEIGNYHGYLHCRIKNTVREAVLVKNPGLETSKSDREYHGFGMKSIQQVIEKYDGNYQRWEVEGAFIQIIYLKYPD